MSVVIYFHIFNLFYFNFVFTFFFRQFWFFISFFFIYKDIRIVHTVIVIFKLHNASLKRIVLCWLRLAFSKLRISLYFLLCFIWFIKNMLSFPNNTFFHKLSCTYNRIRIQWLRFFKRSQPFSFISNLKFGPNVRIFITLVNCVSQLSATHTFFFKSIVFFIIKSVIFFVIFGWMTSEFAS